MPRKVIIDPDTNELRIDYYDSKVTGETIKEPKTETTKNVDLILSLLDNYPNIVSLVQTKNILKGTCEIRILAIKRTK